MQRISEYKRYFLYAMLGSLIVGALVAAASVMIGSFTDTTGKIVATLVTVIFHSLISFFVIPDENKDGFLNKYKIFNDVLFGILVASFFTSLLTIWLLISSDLSLQLYVVYLVTGLTSLQIDVYVLLQPKNKALAIATQIGTVLAMIFGTIIVLLTFGANSWLEDIIDPFYRALGSIGILNASTLVITAVLYKLYMQKHPEEKNVLTMGGHHSILRIIVYIIVGFFALNIIGSLLFALLFSLNRF